MCFICLALCFTILHIVYLMATIQNNWFSWKFRNANFGRWPSELTWINVSTKCCKCKKLKQFKNNLNSTVYTVHKSALICANLWNEVDLKEFDKAVKLDHDIKIYEINMFSGFIFHKFMQVCKWEVIVINENVNKALKYGCVNPSMLLFCLLNVMKGWEVITLRCDLFTFFVWHQNQLFQLKRDPGEQ